MLNWKILRELELWNEKGFVDMAGGQTAPAGASRLSPRSIPSRSAKNGQKPSKNGNPRRLAPKALPSFAAVIRRKKAKSGALSA